MKRFERHDGIADALRWRIHFTMPLPSAILMDKGVQPDSKQLIFDKKYPKSKKKIQSPVLVTFEDQVTDPSMSRHYFSVF
jgi:hypothetical protein